MFACTPFTPQRRVQFLEAWWQIKGKQGFLHRPHYIRKSWAPDQNLSEGDTKGPVRAALRGKGEISRTLRVQVVSQETLDSGVLREICTEFHLAKDKPQGPVFSEAILLGPWASIMGERLHFRSCSKGPYCKGLNWSFTVHDSALIISYQTKTLFTAAPFTSIAAEVNFSDFGRSLKLRFCTRKHAVIFWFMYKQREVVKRWIVSDFIMHPHRRTDVSLQ